VVIDEILRCVGEALDFPKRVELQNELTGLARRYIAVGLTTPLGVPYGPEDETLSKRAAWLVGNVLHPCETLTESLENRPMLSDWPEPIPTPPPDRLFLLKELRKLRDWAERLRLDLAHRIGERANHTREFELEIVFALTDVFRRYFPHRRVSRGKYHRSHGMKGHFPDFIRATAGRILGTHKDMDRAIQQAYKVG